MTTHTQTATNVQTPHQAGFKYSPREAFMPYHERTQRYAVLICHRRAGKTVALLNDTIVRALIPRPDNLRQQFAYICPTATQARSIAWQYLKDFTACFAHCPGYKALEQHLSVTLPDPQNVNKPGSTIMLLGAENAERIRGLFLDGCVIDEAADISPHVVSTIIRPALADRQGWLTISGTLKSPDDLLYTTYELSQKLPLLYFSMLLRADQSKIIPDHELQDLKATMSEEAFNVEMLCDVTKATTGRILLPYLNTKQITRVPYDPEGAPIVIGWDLGIADAMAIWAMQMCGREPHLIHSYEASGQSLENFATHLGKQSWSRRIGAHLLPHDSKVRELGSGKSRLEVMRNLGFRNLKVVPRLSKAEQIEAARLLLPKCWFDEDETAQGRKALRNYSFKFDPDRKVFSQSPLHDQYSNSADAFQTLAVGMKRAIGVTDKYSPGEDIPDGLTGFDDEAQLQGEYELDPGF